METIAGEHSWEYWGNWMRSENPQRGQDKGNRLIKHDKRSSFGSDWFLGSPTRMWGHTQCREVTFTFLTDFRFRLRKRISSTGKAKRNKHENSFNCLFHSMSGKGENPNQACEANSIEFSFIHCIWYQFIEKCGFKELRKNYFSSIFPTDRSSQTVTQFKVLSKVFCPKKVSRFHRAAAWTFPGWAATATPDPSVMWRRWRGKTPLQQEEISSRTRACPSASGHLPQPTGVLRGQSRRSASQTELSLDFDYATLKLLFSFPLIWTEAGEALQVFRLCFGGFFYDLLERVSLLWRSVPWFSSFVGDSRSIIWN